MTALDELSRAPAAAITRLTIASTATIEGPPQGATFDNRSTWDNTGPKFDNRPSWDNWNKKR